MIRKVKIPILNDGQHRDKLGKKLQTNNRTEIDTFQKFINLSWDFRVCSKAGNIDVIWIKLIEGSGALDLRELDHKITWMYLQEMFLHILEDLNHFHFSCVLNKSECSKGLIQFIWFNSFRTRTWNMLSTRIISPALPCEIVNYRFALRNSSDSELVWDLGDNPLQNCNSHTFCRSKIKSRTIGKVDKINFELSGAQEWDSKFEPWWEKDFKGPNW